MRRPTLFATRRLNARASEGLTRAQARTLADLAETGRPPYTLEWPIHPAPPAEPDARHHAPVDTGHTER